MNVEVRTHIGLHVIKGAKKVRALERNFKK